VKVAFLGSRGIPACYGGYETLVEELALGLVSKGNNEVIVYCRSNYFEDKPKNLKGIKLVYLPTMRIKPLESIIHSFLSSIHVLFRDVKVVFFVDPANAPFFLLLRLFGKKVVVHTDGLGWQRLKWNAIERKYYKFVELLCKWMANVLITDNPAMQKYYKDEYNADSVYIPYGASNHDISNTNIYNELGIPEKKYLLLVARLEPENNPGLIIKEYVKADIDMPLVVVGDSPYNPDFMAKLKQAANKKVIFTGFIRDQQKLNALYRGAFIYIHGHEVGGTNPSLLRAMDAATAPLVISSPFNKSVIPDCGYIFEKEEGSLSNILKKLATKPDEVKKIALLAKRQADTNFKWETVVKEYEKVFNKI
jgi:glycosyltransferase involved in cell wall biosynthesis